MLYSVVRVSRSLRCGGRPDSGVFRCGCAGSAGSGTSVRSGRPFRLRCAAAALRRARRRACGGLGRRGLCQSLVVDQADRFVFVVPKRDGFGSDAISADGTHSRDGGRLGDVTAFAGTRHDEKTRFRKVINYEHKFKINDGKYAMLPFVRRCRGASIVRKSGSLRGVSSGEGLDIS